MLNAKQIVDEGLLLLEHTHGKPAQVGYDLSLKAVQKIGTRIGYNIFNDNAIGKVLKNKTELTKYTPKSTIMLDGVEGWILHEGVYDITFNEGCKIPENRVAFIKQRSSLYRNGAIINRVRLKEGGFGFVANVIYRNSNSITYSNRRDYQ